METLTQIAKRLGIKPNPNITDEEFMQIDNLIRTELRRIAPDYKIEDNKYTGGFYTENELYDVIYTLRKSHPLKQAHKFNKLLLDKNIEKFKKDPTPDGIDVFPEDGFWFHSAKPIGQHAAERFQVDIKLDDINMPDVFAKLDKFILKYKSQYKIYPKEDRTDTLNLYMLNPITPQIAKEFYEIVKNVLNDKNHALLDGYPVTMNGKEILGIKFAPEPRTTNNASGETSQERRQRFGRLFQGQNTMKMQNLLVRPTPASVGYLAAKIQECDLIYYLIGREGQNPIQLGNQFGEPGKAYTKTSLDIVENIADRGPVMETLTQIAKRLGIKPNPNITDEEFMQIDKQIRTELRRIAPDYEIEDNKYNKGSVTEQELYNVVYKLRKSHPLKQAHKFNKLLLNSNIKKLENAPIPTGINVIWTHSNDCLRSARTAEQESAGRFQVDIKLDDINIPSVFAELDKFILKYKSEYMVFPEENRTDTLNVHMTTPITPKIAKEFYEIVKGVLNDKNHTLLDGYPITMDGKEIQGIKFAPEPNIIPTHEVRIKRKELFGRLFPGQETTKMRNLLIKDYQESVNQLAAKIQECDLIYYLIGREGQNPIQLGNPFGDPDKVHIKTSLDISDKTNSHSLLIKGILKKNSGYTSKS